MPDDDDEHTVTPPSSLAALHSAGLCPQQQCQFHPQMYMYIFFRIPYWHKCK